MRPIEDDEMRMLFDAEKPFGKCGMNLDLGDGIAETALARDVFEFFVVVVNDSDFLQLHTFSFPQYQILLMLCAHTLMPGRQRRPPARRTSDDSYTSSGARRAFSIGNAA